MKIDDLKKLKVVQLKDIIRNYKKTYTIKGGFSAKKKIELINIILNILKEEDKYKTLSQQLSIEPVKSIPPKPLVKKGVKKSVKKESIDKVIDEWKEETVPLIEQLRTMDNRLFGMKKNINRMIELLEDAEKNISQNKDVKSNQETIDDLIPKIKSKKAEYEQLEKKFILLKDKYKKSKK
jgi:hypothetical protein